MSATDPQTLLTQAKCYLCLGISIGEALQLALLADIVNNGGAGGGGANAPVVYVNDPNLEGLTPSNTSAPAVAYSLNGNGPFYGWSISGQNWL